MLRLAAAFVVLGLPAFAQSGETLADVRAQLNALGGQIASLRAELTATGAQGGTVAGTALDRMNAIEAELTRLTAKTEEIEIRIGRVVQDGTNRIGDLEFRLTELEGGDVSAAGQPKPLGGDGGTPTIAVGEPDPNGAEMAVGEQGDFARAKEALDSGSFQSAAELFAAFAESYPGGPLTGEALYWRGEALMKLGDTTNAARAWLQSFSDAPQGSRAPDALLKLGLALNTLGQAAEACVTLSEVEARYPGSAAAGEATGARAQLGCG
jgi:tol-pal system protein YbgF